MRASRVPAIAALLASVFVMACSDMGVGRKCIVPENTMIMGTLISSPALECPTRLCLVQGDLSGMAKRATCTAFCETDADCASAVLKGNGTDDLLCASSFKCAVATQAGSVKCKKMCVCKDDLECGVNEDGDGGAITPATCPNPTKPTPTCM
jgi:hypothetical protein